MLPSLSPFFSLRYLRRALWSTTKNLLDRKSSLGDTVMITDQILMTGCYVLPSLSLSLSSPFPPYLLLFLSQSIHLYISLSVSYTSSSYFFMIDAF